ncbi:MAG: MmcQ/YjbR family DNA-binding protein [Candidatus Eremiobacteraeota bacterium]|nr:MmcQ/YjbR family DNA-binding protein [Candidatus Eremiobacteraeota bacterium]
MASWSDVRRLALALAETTQDTSYEENRAWRVGGKLFAWERPLRKADLAALGKSAPTGPILGVRTADLKMKEALLARDSRVYFTTPHFDGYPAVLVRLQTIGLRELKTLLVEAWLARAPKRLVNELRKHR